MNHFREAECVRKENHHCNGRCLSIHAQVGLIGGAEEGSSNGYRRHADIKPTSQRGCDKRLHMSRYINHILLITFHILSVKYAKFVTTTTVIAGTTLESSSCSLALIDSASPWIAQMSKYSFRFRRDIPLIIPR